MIRMELVQGCEFERLPVNIIHDVRLYSLLTFKHSAVFE